MGNKNITFNLRFAEIKVSKYAQSDLAKDFDESAKPLIEYQSNFEFKVLKNEKKLVCIVTVKLVIIETKEEFAELKVENSFNLKPFDDIVKTESDGAYKIPNPVLHNIISLSISTVRGILSEKLKGTFVQNEVYPLINAASILKKDNQS